MCLHGGRACGAVRRWVTPVAARFWAPPATLRQTGPLHAQAAAFAASRGLACRADEAAVQRVFAQADRGGLLAKNTKRHCERGQPPAKAAFTAAQIGFFEEVSRDVEADLQRAVALVDRTAEIVAIQEDRIAWEKTTSSWPSHDLAQWRLQTESTIATELRTMKREQDELKKELSLMRKVLAAMRSAQLQRDSPAGFDSAAYSVLVDAARDTETFAASLKKKEDDARQLAIAFWKNEDAIREKEDTIWVTDDAIRVKEDAIWQSERESPMLEMGDALWKARAQLRKRENELRKERLEKRAAENALRLQEFFVELWATATAYRVPQLTDCSTKFCGRRDEIKKVLKWYQFANRGPKEMNPFGCVVGAAASGKSRFMMEVAESLQTEKHPWGMGEDHAVPFQLVPLCIAFSGQTPYKGCIADAADLHNELMLRVVLALKATYCAGSADTAWTPSADALKELTWDVLHVWISRLTARVQQKNNSSLLGTSVRVLLLVDEFPKLFYPRHEPLDDDERLHLLRCVKYCMAPFWMNFSLLMSGLTLDVAYIMDMSDRDLHRVVLGPILERSAADLEDMRAAARSRCHPDLFLAIRTSPGLLGLAIEMGKRAQVPLSMSDFRPAFLTAHESAVLARLLTAYWIQVANADVPCCPHNASTTVTLPAALDAGSLAHETVKRKIDALTGSRPPSFLTLLQMKSLLVHDSRATAVLNPIFLVHAHTRNLVSGEWYWREFLTAWEQYISTFEDSGKPDAQKQKCKNEFFVALLVAGLGLRFHHRAPALGDNDEGCYYKAEGLVELLGGPSVVPPPVKCLDFVVVSHCKIEEASCPLHSEGDDGSVRTDAHGIAFPRAKCNRLCDVVVCGTLVDDAAKQRGRLLLLFETRLWQSADSPNDVVGKVALCLRKILSNPRLRNERQRVAFICLTTDAVTDGEEELRSAARGGELRDLLDRANKAKVDFSAHIVRRPSQPFDSCMMLCLGFLCPDFEPQQRVQQEHVPAFSDTNIGVAHE